MIKASKETLQVAEELRELMSDLADHAVNDIRQHVRENFDPLKCKSIYSFVEELMKTEGMEFIKQVVPKLSEVMSKQLSQLPKNLH